MLGHIQMRPIVAQGSGRVNSWAAHLSQWAVEGLKPSTAHFCYEISGSAGDRLLGAKKR
jgi:hypothetical protein